MAGNKVLQKAKTTKADEFYTQLSDIEKEVRHYKQHFVGKTILCNCDDPYESNFFKYFAMNFNALGLKKLIATCYNGSPVSGNELLLDFGDTIDDPKKVAYKVEITEVKDTNGDGAINLADIKYLMRNDKNIISMLKGNGDFRSSECIELLKQADIVVTNPPFSLFREYIAQLMEYNKNFLIIGRMSCLHYKEIFPLIQQNKIWVGNGFNLSMIYKSTYENTDENNRKYVRSHGYNPDEKYIKVPAILWFTNLDYPKRHDNMVLYRSYDPTLYPKYANFDAIDVNLVSDIPYDFEGIMGVPDTILGQYNPNQFELIGYTSDTQLLAKLGFDRMGEETIKNLRIQGNMAHVTANMKSPYLLVDGKVKLPYSRILIRKRQK